MSENASNAASNAAKWIGSTADETAEKVTVLIKQPAWSDAHAKHLAKLEPDLAAQWIEENAATTDDNTRALLKRAFKHAYYCGAGSNHALRERGV